MTDKIPLRYLPDEEVVPAIGEMRTGETVGIAHGGTGADDAAEAKLNLGINEAPGSASEFPYDVLLPPTSSVGSGQVSRNHSDPTLVTKLYFYHIDSGGTERVNFFQQIKAGDWVNLYDVNSDINREQYDVTGPVVDIGGGVCEIPVAYYDHGGSPFSNGLAVRAYWRVSQDPPNWGEIEGVIGDQADLKAELDNRALLNHDHDGVYDPAGSADTVAQALALHRDDVANPHSVTVNQIGADPVGSADAVQTNLDNHEADNANPHNVTAAQTGADLAGSAEAVQSNLDDHETSYNNPHNVAKAQVGLSQADNTADINKPVSGPQQAAFDAKENLIGAKGTAFNRNFGQTFDTIAEGNDPRFSDARPPTAHTHEGDEVDIVGGTPGNAVRVAADGTLEDAGIPPGGATNLSNTPTSITVIVESSTGSNTAIASATPAAAGVMSVTDKANLDATDAAGTPRPPTAHNHDADYDPLGSAADVQSNLDTHEADQTNPHNVTAAQAGADPVGSAAAVQSNLDTHEADQTNPHNVTAVQAGADPVGSAAAVQSNLDTHEADQTNPHSVTPVQIGAEPEFSKNTAFNKDFGDQADTVAEGDDDRFIKLENAADFLQLAETDALVTGTFYWVPDATFDRPLFFYATGVDTYEAVQLAGKFIRDQHTQGYALVVEGPAGIEGLVGATVEAEDGLWLIGSDSLSPGRAADANRPVHAYGSELNLRAPSIRALLSGAELGSPVIVTGVVSDPDGDLAILGAAPAPIPDFSQSGTSAADVAVIDGAGWTSTQAVLTTLAQDVPLGSTADYQIYVSNPGVASGFITVGFQVEDPVGDPGNWIQSPAEISLPETVAGGKGLYTGFLKTAQGLSAGVNIRMVASAAGEPADVTPGAWAHSSNTLNGAADLQAFRCNNQKPLNVVTFRISTINGAGVDVGAVLLDTEIGSTLAARRAGLETTYTVVSVSSYDTTSVDIGVTNAAGDNKNWSGEVAFDIRLGSASFTPSVLGSVSPTTLTVSVQGSGSGGGGEPNPGLATDQEIIDGTETELRSVSPAKLKLAANTHGRFRLVGVTADRAISIADDGAELACNSADPINLTMDADLPIGFEVLVSRLGTGSVTITPDAADSLNGAGDPLIIDTQYNETRIRRYI